MSDFEQYRVEPQGFWRAGAILGDGYTFMGVAQRHGWTAVALWGSKGWDLGMWPLAMVFHHHREHEAHRDFELAIYVEGDVAMYRFPTQELRDRATDEIAFFYWQHENRPWVAGIENVEQMPAHLRGQYIPLSQGEHAPSVE